MNFNNKKFYLVSLAIIFAGLFFAANVSSVSAAGCSDNEAGISLAAARQTFSKFLNPVASLAEKLVKDFGYQVVWAQTNWTYCAGEGGYCSFSGTKEVRYGNIRDGEYSAFAYGTFTNGVGCNNSVFGDPVFGVYKHCDYRNIGVPDFCSSDSVGCSGTSPYATISWEPAPDIQYYPYSYYLLSISNGGIYNTGRAANYTVYGLANNTTYNWSVNACLTGVPCYAWWAGNNRPYGSFTTGNCVVPPSAPPTNLSASCPAPGNSTTLSWSPVAGATIYAVRVNNLANPWSECRPDPLDSCPDTSATSETIAAVPGASYDWWVHGCNASGCGPATAGNFTCTPPAPTCTPSCGGCSVSCGGGTQTCTRADCSTYSQACNTQSCADFSLNSSNTIYATLVQGQDGDSSATTLTISPFYGFSSRVDLSVQLVSPSLPAGSTYNFSRTSLNQSQYSSGSTFSVHIGAGLSASQTYTITIRAIDGGLVRTTNVLLNAQVRNPDWREI